MDDLEKLDWSLSITLGQLDLQVLLLSKISEDALLHKVELEMIKILRSGEITVKRYEDPKLYLA